MSTKESYLCHLLNIRAVPQLLLFSLMASILALVTTTAKAQLFVPNPLQNPLCSKIGKQIQVSTGLRMYCFGPQPNGPKFSTSTSQSSSGASTSLSNSGSTSTTSSTGTFSFSANVDAASLAEDVNPAGARAYGQSEVSIAGSGPNVVEAWNDASGFCAPCPSP